MLNGHPYTIGEALADNLSIVDLGERISSVKHMRPRKTVVVPPWVPSHAAKHYVSTARVMESTEDFLQRLSEVGEDLSHFAKRVTVNDLQRLGHYVTLDASRADGGHDA
jgi:hypothetical protein